MSEAVVLDASALLALLDDEVGADTVRNVIFHSALSTVSLAEVYAVLSSRGKDGPEALRELRFAVEKVCPFSESQSEIAGMLRPITKPAGLSLGDRACLALAIDLGVPVYTADRVWTTLPLPCDVRLIR